MKDETRRFVDDHHVVVFVFDIERHLFRDDLFAGLFLVRVKDDLVQRPNFIVRLHLLVIHKYHSSL